MRWRGLRFILPAILILTACAPILKQPGPAIGEARLSNDAILTVDGYRLPLRSWKPTSSPPKAILVALHGFNDYSNFFHDPGTYLAEQGFLTYAYDQRGFGETQHRGFWPGTQAYIDDLKTVVRLVRSNHKGVPLYIIGESMGGAVTMVTMTGPEPPKVDGVILSAPAVWGRETMPFYQRWALGVASYTVPWLTLTGRGLKIKPSDNLEMLRALGRDPLVIKETRVDTVHGLTNLMDAALAASDKFDKKSLILYGMRDEVVPKDPTIQMLRRLPKSARQHQRIAIYKKGYHMLLRDLKAKIFWHDIAAWIQNAQAPLPSKADTGARARFVSEKP
ncbi:MAG: alpha/beta hydrolase [Rhodospirillaceae bacterium]|jgi:alpha-beta hydrolase superfamily lysophospholipase|nr:alpha/beta hydrolase [Rhodospirillaceae bacterium]MBT5033850.1 alpha/beta hydrolase [Rhodospirillaceae bacterium]MBT6219751.1 alpha/beta hydrolase [Rhodospirillaceae bacterium]MBT6363746.1 alpha/beta hydrolase [Rhodospirillaceae bacterium]MBT7485028.1 alpha/beta hydrolase [Rhodospirillales bacterium]